MRCAIGAAVAAASAIVFLHWFPALNEGPYGGVDPSLAKLIFFSEPEAWPGVRGGAPLSRQILPTVWPLIAIASNLYILAHCEGRTKRWLWGIVLISLTICAGLALFYQCRFFDYAQPLASLPLVAMVKHDWEISSATYKEHFYRITRLLLVLVIGPSTFLLASSNFNDAPFEKSELTAASAQAPLKGCDMHQLADLLNDKKGLGSRQRIIINSLNEGSELLFRTHDSVLAGPYHLNFQGNMDALHFFTTADPNEAKAIADNRNASLVVFCKMPSQLRAYRNGATTFVKSAFIQQLIDGNIPTWMTQVQSAQLDDLMVFEIK
jgi:hypothetical protein